MNKLILLSLACTGLVAAVPFKANALDATQLGQNLTGGANNTLAQYRQNDRQFSVYYRNRGDRQWILERTYINRGEAERAARRLERRGYNTYVQLSRAVNRRYG
jgi:CelD/BcsL family acetyltransferase involved in cellulose biosynthesis